MMAGLVPDHMQVLRKNCGLKNIRQILGDHPLSKFFLSEVESWKFIFLLK